MLALPSAGALGQETPRPKVERVYGTPVVYAEDGDRFRRVGPVPAGVDLLGARVLRTTPAGYVLLELPTGPLWVDKLNLRFDSALPKADCGALDRSVTSASDSVTLGVRGVGEGCG